MKNKKQFRKFINEFITNTQMVDNIANIYDVKQYLNKIQFDDITITTNQSNVDYFTANIVNYDDIDELHYELCILSRIKLTNKLAILFDVNYQIIVDVIDFNFGTHFELTPNDYKTFKKCLNEMID